MTTFAQRSKRSAFTLVELLVVVGIIATLLVLVVPAFTGLGRGQSMRSAVTQLRTTISLARQWAVTKNETTYVVFPDDDLTYSPPGGVAMALRSYAVWAERSGYISEWRYLPPGVVFNSTQPHPVINTTTEKSGTFNLLLTTNSWGIGVRTNNVAFPTNGAPLRPMYSLGFTPNGRLKQSGGVTISIFMNEGWVDANTNTGVASPPTIKSTNFTMYFEVKPLTGLMRIREL